MAGNVKGITIEFQGDTSKLDRSMRDINQSTREVDKNLRQVNNALKFNPTSVDLWRQKQDLLKTKIADTEDKLKILKQQQASMDASGVDKNSQEYQKLQREIITTESKLKTFKGQLMQIGNAKLTALGASLKETGDKIKTVGANMTKYVTAPIMAVGALSIKAFKDVDAGLDIVTQKTGATGKELEAMHNTVKNIAKDVPSDFQTIGTAVGEVSTKFGIAGQDLQNLSTKFLQFSKLNGTDVNDSIDQTQKALQAFGLDASHAGDLLDTLNKVGQDTGADMNSLLNGLVQNSAAFQSLGLSAQQAAVLMGQLERSGANSETVMQGMRKALKNATEAGIPLDQALGDLEDTIKNGKDGTDGLTQSYKLFGKSGDQIYSAVKNGTLSFKDLGKEALNAGGSVEKTFNETLDTGDKFKLLMQDLQVTGYDVGSVLLDTLAPGIEKVADFIKDMAERWDKLSPGAKKAIVVAALVVAALGPLATIIGSVMTIMGAIIPIIGVVTTAFAALSAPVLIVIGVIGGLIAIIVLLVKNWDKIKKKADEIGKSVKKAFDKLGKDVSKVFENMKNAVSTVWENIKTAISTKIENIKTNVKNKIDAVATTVSNVFTTLKTTVSTAWENIKTAIGTKVENIKTNVKNKIDAVATTVSNVFTTLKNTVSTAWENIKTAIGTKVENIKTNVKSKIDAVATTVRNVFTNLRGSVSTAWENIKTAIGTKVDNIKTSVKDKIDGVINSITSAFGGLKDKIGGKISEALSSIKEKFSNFKIPKFKLPGFKIIGSPPFGLGGKGTPIKIKWNAEGAIFKRPTVFATRNGFQGVGEAGAEAVLPISKLQEMVDFGNAKGMAVMEQQTRVLLAIYEELQKEKNFKVDGMWAGRYINSYVR